MAYYSISLYLLVTFYPPVCLSGILVLLFGNLSFSFWMHLGRWWIKATRLQTILPACSHVPVPIHSLYLSQSISQPCQTVHDKWTSIVFQKPHVLYIFHLTVHLTFRMCKALLSDNIHQFIHFTGKTAWFFCTTLLVIKPFSIKDKASWLS